MGAARAWRREGDQVTQRGPRWPVPLTIALVLLVMGGSVTAGLRLPFSPFRDTRGAIGKLDYSRGPVTEYGALRDSFVQSVVGGPAQEDGTAPALSTPDRALPAQHESFAVGRGPIVVTHPLTNDGVERAYAVGGLPFTAHTDSRNATRQAAEPGSCSPVGGTIWYRYTAPVNLGLAANTFGSKQTAALAVFSGRPGHLSSLGCDQDAQGDAAVAFAATAGTTYYFQLTFPAGGGPTTFDLGLQGRTSRFLSSGPLQVVGIGGISGDGRYVAFDAIGRPGVGVSPNQCAGVVVFVPLAPSQVCEVRSYLLERRTGRVIAVSVSSTGEEANDLTIVSGMSDDARYVTFQSAATNLVPGDTNSCPPFGAFPGSCPDIFVHDRITGKTVRVSVSSSGRQGNSWSWVTEISSDGRYVVFGSEATNLVDHPSTSSCPRQVYVHDRDVMSTGVFDQPGPGRTRTFLASVADDGTPGNCDRSQGLPGDTPGSEVFGLSHNSRYIIFRSSSSNLVRGTHNHRFNVFVRDLVGRKTTMANVASTGEQANADTWYPFALSHAVSDDGCIAVFGSTASNLVTGDTNGTEDVFLRNTCRGTTERVTVDSGGRQAEGESNVSKEVLIDFANFSSLPLFGVSQSPLEFFLVDTRGVVFSSGATNLVPDDTNGARDIFERDIVHRTTTRLSVSTAGRQANGASVLPTVTNDGRTITFESEATNLDDSSQQTTPAVLNESYVRELP